MTQKGKNQVDKVTNGERGKNVTVMCTMNATGTYLAPMLIYPRKRLADALLKGAHFLGI